MKELRTEIEINTTAKKAWNLLTDLKGYERWNPFIVYAAGTIDGPGAKFTIRVVPPGSWTWNFAVTALSYHKEKEMSWVGCMFSKWILEGIRTFEIHELSPRTVRVVHRESWTGLLLPFVWRTFIQSRIRQGFEAMNAKMKLVLEQDEPI